MQREGFGIRLGAALIDVAFVLIGSFIVTFATAMIAGAYVAGVVASLLGLGYTALEVLKGATPGKMLLKLQIRDESGNEASREQFIKRWAIKNVSSVLGLLTAVTTLAFFNWIGALAGLGIFVGCFMCLKPHKQAWHDTIAKTSVCRQAAAGFAVLPVAQPAVAVDATEQKKAA